jgi:hypothetical protein
MASHRLLHSTWISRQKGQLRSVQNPLLFFDLRLQEGQTLMIELQKLHILSSVALTFALHFK